VRARTFRSVEGVGRGAVRLREPVIPRDLAQSWKRGALTQSREGAKKAREEFCEGFLNLKGQAAAVVNEAVLADASCWCRAFLTVPTKTPNDTAHVTPGETYGRGTGGA
jgi:hypothetical protein